MLGWQAAYAAGRESERRQKWSVAETMYAVASRLTNHSHPKINYRLGYVHFRQNNIDQAIKYTENAVRLDPEEAIWKYKLGFYLERQKSFARAIELYDQSLALLPEQGNVFYHKYSCFAALGQRKDAIDALMAAAALDKKNKKYQILLAESIHKTGPLWREAEFLEEHRDLFKNDHDWTLRLANANARLSKSKISAKEYSALNASPMGNAKTNYEEGYQWHLSGDNVLAGHAYDKAIILDTKLSAKEYGIGAFHQAHQRWTDAAESYADETTRQPENAGLWYRLGFAFDRCSEWPAAVNAYTTAVIQSPFEPYWHYKLGFALERSEKWNEAGDVYSYAASMESGKPYWYYRAGFCYSKASNLDKSCKAFVESSPLQLSSSGQLNEGKFYSELVNRFLDGNSKASIKSTVQRNPDVLRRIGQQAAAEGKWELAAEYFQRAIRNNNDHSDQLYYLLGFSQYQQNMLAQAVESFKQTRIFMTPDGVNLQKYLADKALRNSMEFIELMESLQLEQDTILWESNHGASVGCHPLAIFRKIIADPAYEGFKHIWAVKSKQDIPLDVVSHANVDFVKINSYSYKKALATSRFVVNNVSFPPYYMRRDGQSYLNTWHGTPFKTLGKDMKGPVLQHANLARNFLQSTHIMSPNEHTTWALINRHDIEGIFTGKIETTGSPRLDRMVNQTQDLRHELRLRLGIDPLDNKPVVLYAPTWRGESDKRSVDVPTLKDDLSAMTSKNHHLIFRAHRLTENLLADVTLPVTVVPKDIDTSDLLAAVDVLVTDYSSICFDFLPLNRPIIYFVPDIEEYQSDRGLYLKRSEMPGIFCDTHLQIIDTLNSLTLAPLVDAPIYEAAKERFAPKEDGNASQRVIDFFFRNIGEHKSEPEDRKQTLLFHQSLIPNGIATSFQNLVSSIDPSKYRLVLVVEPSVLARDKGRLEKLLELPDHVQIVGRTGTYATRPEERYLDGVRKQKYKLTNEEQFGIYLSGYRREFRRIFGTKIFDAQIEFDGYSSTWASLMSTGADKATKLIYLHNDMMQEWRVKYPELEGAFHLYKRFDRYISVAESVNAINADGISPAFGLVHSKFDFCNNQINPSQVLNKAALPLDNDLQSWYEGATTNIIAIGRMSPEKDHRKLIRAFAAFHSDHPDSNLVILGDGPLRSDLEALVLELGASGSIWLAGQRSNPYPALSAASAFVLSSVHEGQPMVIFEAMILGKKIIATDLPGPASMLAPGHGLIVKNSVAGLLEGFQLIDNSKFPNDLFCSEAYQEEARSKFLALASKIYNEGAGGGVKPS